MASDESELIELRTDLAGYSFSENPDIPRFPAHELAEQKGSVSVYCTPYFDRELHGILAEYTGESGKGALKTAVFSAALSTADFPVSDLPTSDIGKEKNANSAVETERGGGEVDG